jgi:hypothetical protein
VFVVTIARHATRLARSDPIPNTQKSMHGRQPHLNRANGCDRSCDEAGPFAR